jgi:hypothetical protein
MMIQQVPHVECEYLVIARRGNGERITQRVNTERLIYADCDPLDGEGVRARWQWEQNCNLGMFDAARIIWSEISRVWIKLDGRSAELVSAQDGLELQCEGWNW